MASLLYFWWQVFLWSISGQICPEFNYRAETANKCLQLKRSSKSWESLVLRESSHQRDGIEETCFSLSKLETPTLRHKYLAYFRSAVLGEKFKIPKFNFLHQHCTLQVNFLNPHLGIWIWRHIVSLYINLEYLFSSLIEKFDYHLYYVALCISGKVCSSGWVSTDMCRHIEFLCLRCLYI